MLHFDFVIRRFVLRDFLFQMYIFTASARYLIFQD